MPLGALSFTDIASAVRSGDLLLYVDPSRTPTPPPGALAAIAARLATCVATLPFGTNGARMRSDWTSVACLTVFAKAVHVVAYGIVDPAAPPEFCMYPAAEFLAERGVTRFAVRPMYASAGSDERTLCAQIARVVYELNIGDTERRAAARRDDVTLACEIYWRLTGAPLADLDEPSSPRSTVAEIFGAGGRVDLAMVQNPLGRRFQFGAEVCGWR